MLRLALTLAAFTALSACNRPCPQPEAVTEADGGVATCVQSETCPRPSSVLVCSQDLDQLRDCVACEDNRCVRYRPGTCP